MSTYTLALTRKIAGRSSSLLETFLELDNDGDGTISRSDLAISLKTLFNLNLSREQLNSLCSKFGCTGGKRVDYSRFVDCVRDLATSRPLTSASYGAGEGLERGTADYTDADMQRLGIVKVPEGVEKSNLEKVIARKIRSRSAVASKTTQTFLAIDSDRSGSFTLAEFREFLLNVGLDVSETQCSLVLGDYLSKDGEVHLAGFSQLLKAIEPTRQVMPWEVLDEESLRRERTVAKAMAKAARKAMEYAVTKCVDDAMTDSKILFELQENLLEKKTTLVKAFKKFDMDAHGSLTKEEFTQGLRMSGLDVSEERAGKLIEKFDVNGDGRLACWEFIRMVTAGTEEMEQGGELLPGEISPTPPPLSDLIVKGDEGEEVQAEIIKKLEVDEDELLRNFKMQLEEENMKMRKVFVKIAQGGKTVSSAQLLQGLKEMGCNLDKDAADRIIDKFDVEGTGDLKYYEFLRMMNDVY